MQSRQLKFESSGLVLQAVFDVPESKHKVPGVVICNPHPRFGGDITNDVIVILCDNLNSAGIATFRFNFRGVGTSEGVHDYGNGEVDDAESALSTLALQDCIDPSRIGIAGYSFGASIALQAAIDSNLVQAIFSVACPVGAFRALSSKELLQPKMFVLGDHDHDFPVDEFRFLTKRYSQPKDVSVIHNADHFFRGFESTVGELAATFFHCVVGESNIEV